MKQYPILVTGATGFIGSHLIRRLMAKGAIVVASNVSGSCRHLEDLQDKVKITQANIAYFTDVLRLIESLRPQVIYHVGAMLAPACDEYPATGIQTNAMGTYHILEAARLFGVRQVIFASSMSVFSGAYSTQPVLNDFSVTRPDFVYGIAKLFSENIGLFFKRKYGLDYRGIRLPNVIGPGAETHGYLEYFNKTIERSARRQPYTVYVRPETTIPVIHIEDATRAFIEIAEAPLDQIKTTNYMVLGPQPSPSHGDLVACLQKRIPGVRIEYEINEQIQKLIDDSCAKAYQDACARSEWGWKERYGLTEMIDSFLEEQVTPS